MIETTRLRDANQQEPSSSVVQSVEFHPAGRLLLTAGLDKRLRLFQVTNLPLQNTLRLIVGVMPVPAVDCWLDKTMCLCQLRHDTDCR